MLIVYSRLACTG